MFIQAISVTSSKVQHLSSSSSKFSSTQNISSLCTTYSLGTEGSTLDMKLNLLEANLDSLDPTSMLNYVVLKIDLRKLDTNHIHYFKEAINDIAFAFKSNCMDSFETSKLYAISGRIGHDSNGSPELLDDMNLKQAYICLQIVLGSL